MPTGDPVINNLAAGIDIPLTGDPLAYTTAVIAANGGVGGGAEGGGTTNHALLTNRNAANQHTMSAITGLADKVTELEASAATAVTAHNASTTAHNDIRTEIAGKEPVVTKNTAFNKDFGTSSDTVTEGNDARVVNAIQGVKLNGQLVTPDTQKVVNIAVSGGGGGCALNYRGAVAFVTQTASELRAFASAHNFQIPDAVTGITLDFGNTENTCRTYTYNAANDEWVQAEDITIAPFDCWSTGIVEAVNDYYWLSVAEGTRQWIPSKGYIAVESKLITLMQNKANREDIEATVQNGQLMTIPSSAVMDYIQFDTTTTPDMTGVDDNLVGLVFEKDGTTIYVGKLAAVPEVGVPHPGIWKITADSSTGTELFTVEPVWSSEVVEGFTVGWYNGGQVNLWGCVLVTNEGVPETWPEFSSADSTYQTAHRRLLDLRDKVNKNQGMANSGKVLGVGSDGMVTVLEAAPGVGVLRRWDDLYPAPAIGDFIAYLSALPLNSVTNLFMLANNANRAMTGIPSTVISGVSFEHEGLFFTISKAKDSQAAELFLQQDRTTWIGRFSGAIVFWSQSPNQAFAYHNDIDSSIVNNAPTFGIPDFYGLYYEDGSILPNITESSLVMVESIGNGRLQRFSYPQGTETQGPPEAVVYERSWDPYNGVWTALVQFGPAAPAKYNHAISLTGTDGDGNKVAVSFNVMSSSNTPYTSYKDLPPNASITTSGVMYVDGEGTVIPYKMNTTTTPPSITCMMLNNGSQFIYQGVTSTWAPLVLIDTVS
jgi:hypothetical protein